MLKKIIQILIKIVIGIFLFYLITGFILIPLILTWAIPSQGTKFLKTPVHVRSVELNPFLFQLKIRGLEILDSEKQAVFGFDRLFVDVSFLQLVKKVYRVETFQLDGLKINVELLANGHINLLDLVPKELMPAQSPTSTQAHGQTSKAKQSTLSSSLSPSTKSTSTTSLPTVIIDKVDLRGGKIHFVDTTIQPNFATSLSQMEIHIDHFSTNPQDQTHLKFQILLDEKGKITAEVLIKPLAVPLQLEANTNINDYAMTILTPYVGKYTGHSLSNGKLDFRMDYKISDNKLTAGHKILIQKFEFGSKVESKDALPLPFGLAVALLEDPQGKINISLPVTGNLSDPKFEYFHLIGQVARNFFLKLVTKPFSFLASMLGSGNSGTDELGYVRFMPGKADLSDEEKNKLSTLIKGLKERPKLRLEINGSYDPQVDWKAIQVEVFTKDYEKLRKDSTRPESKVYQQLFQRRFGIRALWALAKKYKEGVGNYKDEKLDQEIKRQLIEKAPPDQGALGILAQARAQLVYDFFESSSFDVQRLSIGQPHSVQSSMGYVPLEFTLTVFESQSTIKPQDSK